MTRPAFEAASTYLDNMSSVFAAASGDGAVSRAW